jgi:hypothetical protein
LEVGLGAWSRAVLREILKGPIVLILVGSLSAWSRAVLKEILKGPIASLLFAVWKSNPDRREAEYQSCSDT